MHSRCLPTYRWKWDRDTPANDHEAIEATSQHISDGVQRHQVPLLVCHSVPPYGHEGIDEVLIRSHQVLEGALLATPDKGTNP
jgi:hypothetical protein